MNIRRLQKGDELDALEGVRVLKEPNDERGRASGVEHMLRLLSDDRNYFYLATEAGAPVGFLIAYRFPRIDRYEEMIYLYEIGVDELHRRRGIGTGLIEALKRDAKDGPVMKIWVGTEVDNELARRLYESTGARLQHDAFVEYVYENLDDRE